MDANRTTAYSEHPTEDQIMKKSIIITGAGRGIGAAPNPAPALPP